MICSPWNTSESNFTLLPAAWAYLEQFLGLPAGPFKTGHTSHWEMQYFVLQAAGFSRELTSLQAGQVLGCKYDTRIARVRSEKWHTLKIQNKIKIKQKEAWARFVCVLERSLDL